MQKLIQLDCVFSLLYRAQDRSQAAVLIVLLLSQRQERCTHGTATVTEILTALQFSHLVIDCAIVLTLH